MASILPCIRPRGDFDEETTRLMGEAFDAARAALHDQGQLFTESSPTVYGIIAKRIIEAAKKGERDPIRLRDAGLAALGYKSDIG
jgi:hypothetical protein